MQKKNKGITLIALIITIIVLLILAGIVISLAIGENGIIKKASQVGLTYDEKQAREKLELVLLDMQAEKITKSEYNQEDYLTKKIEENGMIVNGDIVFVNEWQFQIDRSIPEMLLSLGKGKPNYEIRISATTTTSSDYAKSVIKIEVEYAEEIKHISLAGEELAIPEKIDGKYTLEKEVTSNGTYAVMAKDAEDKYQISNVRVTDLTEDMNIYTAQDLETFRDNVNMGRTYEGKTVLLMNDIDLSTVCGENIGSWLPIGAYQIKDSLTFAGIFEGNNHTIHNLYINSSEERLGLFRNIDGEVKNLTLDNAYVNSKTRTTGILSSCCDNGTISNVTVKGKVTSTAIQAAGVVGYSGWGATISRCKNYAMVTSTDQYTGGIVGQGRGTITQCVNYADINSSAAFTGGIVGYTEAVEIALCYNKGNITNSSYACGGVAGLNYNGTIKYSYNVGNINAKGKTSANYTNVAGIAGYNKGSIENTYSTGTVTGATSNGVGLLIGQQLDNGAAYLKNSYAISYNSLNVIGYRKTGSSTGNEILITDALKGWDQSTIDAKLTDNFIKDENNINNGYPILRWQVE